MDGKIPRPQIDVSSIFCLPADSAVFAVINDHTVVRGFVVNRKGFPCQGQIMQLDARKQRDAGARLDAGPVLVCWEKFLFHPVFSPVVSSGRRFP